MQGSINFDGSLVGNITGGGGGGGDTVVITPLVTSGTKIADVSVGGVEKDLYTPDYGADIAALDGRLDIAEDNITSLTGRVGTAEGNITSLAGHMTEAETDITEIKQSLSDFETLEKTASGAIATFDDGSDLPMPSLKVAIEPVQSGSGDPSPTNVRPISGWSEANVQLNDGQNIFGGTFNTLFPLFIKKNTRITVSAKTQTSFAVFNKEKNQIDYWGLYNVDSITGRYYRTFNFQYDIYYVKFIYTLAEELQIKIGTDVTYSAYNGHTYTIDLDGTRYGGELDVVSGVLTITNGYIASYNGETIPSIWISDRDVYAEGTTPTVGAEVVYKLATPQSAQLTPTQVNSLLGVNNIYADTGDLELTYFVNNSLVQAIYDMLNIFRRG